MINKNAYVPQTMSIDISKAIKLINYNAYTIEAIENLHKDLIFQQMELLKRTYPIKHPGICEHNDRKGEKL